jgi:hypothetical protein
LLLSKGFPVITGHIKDFTARCVQRGYTLKEVCACIVSEDGDQITVDVNHPAYPREPKPGFVKPKATPRTPPPTHGPGVELKKLLSLVGIVATPNCACNARARMMDEYEARKPGWCLEHIDEIVGWLREEAAKRSLPFLDAAARLLVRRAISNARREQARATQAANAEGSDEA